MLDISEIRKNPTVFQQMLADRGSSLSVEHLLELDTRRRKILSLKHEIETQINQLNDSIGKFYKIGRQDAAAPLKEQTLELKAEIIKVSDKAQEAKDDYDNYLLMFPNRPHDHVPIGPDEKSNLVVRTVDRREEPGLTFEPQAVNHWEIGTEWGFDIASKISGPRFAFLQGNLAKLHRVLGQFMLDCHTANGFQEMMPPSLVRAPALKGTGQLPKFEEDLFRAGDHYLIPTAEVPLTNFLTGSPINSGIYRYCALTNCYRSEAGSAGRDTRGLIRQHEFQKVELVTICPEEEKHIELGFMLGRASSILELLNLPHRQVLLCSGDIGFSAEKTWDLEVWLPGQQTYREISSVSCCGVFQSRRMGLKFKDTKKLPATLNGSGLAVGRTLVAVVENYYHDGKIYIPTVLQSRMGCRYFDVR